jgi:two-component system chemotaxis sensor kinase CheA
MTDNKEETGNIPHEMAEYLQTFLDETEEQLDDLVETMLALERDPTNKEDLNEAFRLIHSIKGSAGIMGFDNITVLTHHLENRFERFRSGLGLLDEPTMNLVLRCIDFLRQCNNRLRDGEQLASSTELLDELKRLEERVDESGIGHPEQTTGEQPDAVADGPKSLDSEPPEEGVDSDAAIRMVVRFRAGLQLADLKAQLIVARLSGLGEVHSTQPDLQRLSDAQQVEEFEVRVETQAGLDRLRAAADVDGVESIEFPAAPTEPSAEVIAGEESQQDVVADEPMTADDTAVTGESPDKELEMTPAVQSEPDGALNQAESPTKSAPDAEPSESAAVMQQPSATPDLSASDKTTTKVAETMRVDIDRLDNLMNLAGELVVNRARFVQISGQISPALRKASMLNRVRDFSDSLQRAIEAMEKLDGADGDWPAQIQQLRAGLELMDEQSEVWENGRQCFSQIGEAIDQLSRVSHSLQRGVLDTRMVPVAPLFNRFKRVVRDLSKERGKKVNLLIRGEKTELDKRMIDELGDPLVHLVRNSIDHGLESPDVRVGLGKPEVGTILLEASHSGNNVYIHVRDDGGGIDVEKIRAKLIDNRILSGSAADGLSDDQALDYIWHPGFSTAQVVTDVSGRGVGMDVVKTRINQLNGTIQVDSIPQQGTTFAIRLPLTLAIISSLLVRLRNVIFSMPIDDVREIVSVEERDVVTVHGKQTIDVRGEFIPLVRIDEVFRWHGIDYGHDGAKEADPTDSTSRFVEVVILHAGGKTMGLRVDELLGSQDIVIKSLSDNFISIRGLSGASILGDGRVCLMLDVGTVISMATGHSRNVETEEAVS